MRTISFIFTHELNDHCHPQVDEVKYLGFVNKEADEPSKMGTRLSVPQREFFKAVVRDNCARFFNNCNRTAHASIHLDYKSLSL